MKLNKEIALLIRKLRQYEIADVLERIGPLSKFREKLLIESLLKTYRTGYQVGKIAGAAMFVADDSR